MDMNTDMTSTKGERKCDQCQTVSASLRRCTGCPPGSALRYCGRACQAASWKAGHSRLCARGSVSFGPSDVLTPEEARMVRDLGDRNHGTLSVDRSLQRMVSHVEANGSSFVDRVVLSEDSEGLFPTLVDLLESMSESVLIKVIRLFQKVIDRDAAFCRSKFLEIARVEPRLVRIMKIDANRGTPYVTSLRVAAHNVLFATDIVARHIPTLIRCISGGESVLEDTLIRISLVLEKREDRYTRSKSRNKENQKDKENEKDNEKDEYFLSTIIVAGLIEELDKFKDKHRIVRNFGLALLTSINHDAHMIDSRVAEKLCVILERSGLRDSVQCIRKNPCIRKTHVHTKDPV
jgi:hypothetical protein